MTIHRRACLGLTLAAVPAVAQSFDHGYAALDGLLKTHVRWQPDNKQSRVAYKALAADRAKLQAVLQNMSGVSAAQYLAWSKPEQMAFLINAYNAFTLELILSKYPDLVSIKDLGNLLQSPWKKPFFSLLGEARHLDWIEHEQLRVKFAEPRIHAAIVCASIGCPALRPEAFTPAKLEAQLEDGMQRFLGDKTRNRFAAGKLEVSQIFKWFRADFEKGHQGFATLQDVWARYADALSSNPTEAATLRQKSISTWSHLNYDWSLNDLGR